MSTEEIQQQTKKIQQQTKEIQQQTRELEAILRRLGPIDDLITLLGQMRCSLSSVCPGRSMENREQPPDIFYALRSLADVLVGSHFLLEHSDDDVKVAVACCLSEITRITAPLPPCINDKMKKIFKLIVSSFEKLHDQSCELYNKRVSILETVAKIKLCVVMVELDCDDLIIKMFRLFFEAIREFHQEEVFWYMVMVMSHVLEESELGSLKLLPLLLASVQRDDKVMVKKLGETVLAKSSAKLRPYLKRTVTSLINNFKEVVASLSDDDDVDQVDDSSRKPIGCLTSMKN